MTIPWLPLGARRPRTLRDARLVLHHAAWVLGSVADSLLHHEPDDAHTSLGFDPRGGTLFTHRLGPEKHAPSLHLVLESLKLELRRDAGETIANRRLAGLTMAEAFAWVEAHARDGWSPDAKVAMRAYEDFPDHPIGQGGAFDPPDTAANAELTRWYANANLVIPTLRKPWASLSDARVWPHHFDLSAQIPLSRDESGDDENERARSASACRREMRSTRSPTSTARPIRNRIRSTCPTCPPATGTATSSCPRS